MIAVLLAAMLVVLILAALAVVGLLSTAIMQLRLIAGALSMIATMLDEPDDPAIYGVNPGRKIMREIGAAIYNGITDAMHNQQRH